MSVKRNKKEKDKIKENKKTKLNLKNIIKIVFLIIFISIMIFTGIEIIKWLKENKESNDIIEDIQDAISINENIDIVDKYNVNFEELKQKNSDTIAWIKVNGTNIEYPVVKNKIMIII